MARTAGHTMLTQDACWALLQTVGVGRVSYTEMALPVIRAVPFVVDGGSVIAAVGLSPLRPDLFDMPTVVAFEAGEWDQRRHEGWTVHFIGKARAVFDHESAEIAAMGLASWIDGEPAVYVRINAEMVSGVQVGAGVPVLRAS